MYGPKGAVLLLCNRSGVILKTLQQVKTRLIEQERGLKDSASWNKQ